MIFSIAGIIFLCKYWNFFYEGIFREMNIEMGLNQRDLIISI